MKINLETLYPWADVHRILSNMRSLEVTVDGKSAGTEADLSIDQFGRVTLALGKKKDKKKRGR